MSPQVQYVVTEFISKNVSITHVLSGRYANSYLEEVCLKGNIRNVRKINNEVTFTVLQPNKRKTKFSVTAELTGE